MTFEELWNTYPAKSQHKGPKAAAEKIFNRLNMYEWHEVELSLPVYAEHLSENEWKNPMMVRTYIGPQRCWEGFQPSKKVEADIEKIEERKKAHQERNARLQVYADEQWRERYKRVIGHEPKGI